MSSSGTPREHVKPIVGIIYSNSSKTTLESENFAKYIGAHFVATGYCECRLIGFRQNNEHTPDRLPQERIRYHPYEGASDKPREVPASDLRYDHWSSLSSCHVIITTVAPCDAEACGEKLRDNLESKLLQTTFTMQKGVRAGTTLRDIVHGKKGMTVIECAVGFSVIPHPSTGALTTTLPSYSHLLIERLTKDMVKTSDGAVNLVETLPFQITFRKVLTTSCWGLAQYDCLSALQLVLSLLEQSSPYSTISHCLNTRELRLIYAAMLRETTKCLTCAAQGGGGWTPDLLLISCTYGSPWLLEMLLTMWTYTGFILACWLSGISFSPFTSPGIFDHVERRESLVRLQLQELLASGDKYNMKMPVTAAVCDRLLELETSGSGYGAPGSQTLFIGELNSLVKEYHIDSKNGSIHEARYWFIRYLTILSVLNAIYFLLFH